MYTIIVSPDEDFIKEAKKIQQQDGDALIYAKDVAKNCGYNNYEITLDKARKIFKKMIKIKRLAYSKTRIELFLKEDNIVSRFYTKDFRIYWFEEWVTSNSYDLKLIDCTDLI